MNTVQRTRQQKACHIRFKQLQREGVIPDAFNVYEYARHIVAREIGSLKELKDWELNALRDTLEGKPNKMAEKLLTAAVAAGIRDLEAYLRKLATSPVFSSFRGYTLETLPLTLQWRLLNCIGTRVPKQPREQTPTLFGN